MGPEAKRTIYANESNIVSASHSFTKGMSSLSVSPEILFGIFFLWEEMRINSVTAPQGFYKV